MFNYIKIFIWSALIYWAGLYISIQLDRLNSQYFSAAAQKAQQNLIDTKGILYYFALIMYSPYLMPIKSAIAWVISVTFLIFF